MTDTPVLFSEISSVRVIELHPTEICGEPNDSLDYDYYGVAVEVNGQEIKRFGDACHDRGRERAQGFAAGLIAAFTALGKPAPEFFETSSRLDDSVNE